MGKNSIELSILISASASQVWSCLTDLAKIRQWWSSRVYLEPYSKGKFEEIWANEYGQTVITRGKVLSIQPPQKLILSWADEDWSVETEVTFLVLPVEYKIRLTLLHRGWDKFPNDISTTLRTHHREGWSELLKSLKEFVETTSKHYQIHPP